MNCLECGGDNIFEETDLHEICCDDCGFAWKNDKPVEFDEYCENRGGGVVKVGIIVNKLSSQSYYTKKARERFENIATQLGMAKNLVDKATEIYKKALEMKLTSGCRSSLMTGACLYLSCRLSDKPFFLLEISDKVNENLFNVGKIYKRLQRKLHLHPKPFDGSIYLSRLVNKLEFNEKTNSVLTTSIEVFKLVTNDPSSFGKPPMENASLAVLISSLMHRFDRQIGDISRLVGITQNTIKKRLDNFLKTNMASKMTLNEAINKIENKPLPETKNVSNQIYKSAQDNKEISKEIFSNKETLSDDEDDDFIQNMIFSDKEAVKRKEWILSDKATRRYLRKKDKRDRIKSDLKKNLTCKKDISNSSNVKLKEPKYDDEDNQSVHTSIDCNWDADHDNENHSKLDNEDNQSVHTNMNDNWDDDHNNSKYEEFSDFEDY